ncbi:MAG: helix-turn-helix transcriptional regulator [Chloroflexota bacterium]
MTFASWLKQQLKQRGWTVNSLVEKTGLTPTTVTEILKDEEKPDFDACYRIAEALDKQPERLLHMAGLLSPEGLKLALAMSADRISTSRDIRYLVQRVSIDERRLIMSCRERQGALNPIHFNEIRPTPQEFNWEERTQDRIRFAKLMGTMLFILIGVGLAVGWLLS